jgi:hypothetical protein
MLLRTNTISRLPRCRSAVMRSPPSAAARASHITGTATTAPATATTPLLSDRSQPPIISGVVGPAGDEVISISTAAAAAAAAAAEVVPTQANKACSAKYYAYIAAICATLVVVACIFQPAAAAAAAKNSSTPEVNNVTLTRIYLEEGLVIRGWESCYGWEPRTIMRCMKMELGGYCDHEPRSSSSSSGTRDNLPCTTPVSAPATLLHPNLTILQHPFEAWFQGTPRYKLNRPGYRTRANTRTWQIWVFSLFRGRQPAECTYPQDAWGLASGCSRNGGRCPAGMSGEANARLFLGNNLGTPLPGGNAVPGRQHMCAFPATPVGDRQLVAAQNLICRARNASFRDPPSNSSLITSWAQGPNGTFVPLRNGSICEENQRQVYWSGHTDILALTYLFPEHRTLAMTVQSAIFNYTGRTIPLMYTRYVRSLRRLHFAL